MNELHAKLTVQLYTDDKCFGPGVATLLTQVDDCHSLRAAAMSMGMAYSKAWTIVKNAEERLGIPLLISQTGGKHGGGAALTDEAKRLLAGYRDYVAALRAYGDRLFDEHFSWIPKP